MRQGSWLPTLLASTLLAAINTSSAFVYNQGYDTGDALTPMLTGSQCFKVKGVPTLKLQCPGGQMIRVHRSFYATAPDNTTCSYKAPENHCIQLADMQHNCMGRYMCYVYVSNPYLVNCRTYASYMQINYTCIPKTEAVDMCSSISQTVRQGFLRTPNYPDANYTNDLHCQCELSTQADSPILLQVLDFSVHHTEVGTCESDHLAISGWGKKCGTVSSDRLPETLEVNHSQVTLQFHSDALKTGRGIWLQYSGSQESSVTISCKRLQRSSPPPTLPPGDATSRIKPIAKGIQPTATKTKQTESRWKTWKKSNGYVKEQENAVLIDDTDAYPTPHKAGSDEGVGNILGNFPGKVKVVDDAQGTKDEEQVEQEQDFNTYDFTDSQESYGMNNIDKVQVATGTVVGVLILTAIIIIIVLVFRR